MKKLIIILSLVFGITSLLYASNGASVTDNAGGNKGYILINDGTGQGHKGTWTDPSFLKGEKGDKGDNGDTGQTGKDGINGINGKNGQDGEDGINGINGINGKDGLAGIDGKNGLNGANGNAGDKGDKGENGKDIDPVIVTNLQNEDINLDNKIKLNTSSINNQAKTLQDHTNKLNDHENRINDLEKTQYVIEGGARIIDTKKWEVTSFIRYNETRNVIDTVGVRCIFKFGKSYEEILIEKQNNRLTELERKLNNSYTIEKVFDTKGNLKSEKISAIK